MTFVMPSKKYSSPNTVSPHSEVCRNVSRHHARSKDSENPTSVELSSHLIRGIHNKPRTNQFDQVVLTNLTPSCANAFNSNAIEPAIKD